MDVGDRRIIAVRPPVYDSPATRGFLDERSGVYWGVDAFATPSPGDPVPTVADLDPEFWAQPVPPVPDQTTLDTILAVTAKAAV